MTAKCRKPSLARTLLGETKYPAKFPGVFFVPGRQPPGIVTQANGAVGINIYGVCEFVGIDVA